MPYHCGLVISNYYNSIQWRHSALRPAAASGHLWYYSYCLTDTGFYWLMPVSLFREQVAKLLQYNAYITLFFLLLHLVKYNTLVMIKIMVNVKQN